MLSHLETVYEIRDKIDPGFCRSLSLEIFSTLMNRASTYLFRNQLQVDLHSGTYRNTRHAHHTSQRIHDILRLSGHGEIEFREKEAGCKICVATANNL